MKKELKFNLENVNKILSKEINGVVTDRSNNLVEIVKTDLLDPLGKCILAVVNTKSKEQQIRCFFSDGKFYKDKISLMDLVINVFCDFSNINKGAFVKIHNVTDNTTFIGIFEKILGDYVYFKYGGFINKDGKLYGLERNIKSELTKSPLLIDDIDEIELCKENEQSILIKELKKLNIKWNSESKQFIEENDLELGDKVLGVDGSGNWRLDFFSHMDLRGYFVCTGRTYKTVVKLTEESKSLINKS